MKRRKTHDGEGQHQRTNSNQDDDYIPLPIQTFLWRQTSPFVRPFLVKKAREMAQLEQRDACKLFERIIVTNNIWGQSPSLTDAIGSVDRWRLIKVSFPFILQCTAALLNNKLIKDHNFNRLGGNEAKMMYTLQWILMNASEECADSENEAKAKATNAAIAAATAASLLKPSSSALSAGSGSNQQQQQQQQLPPQNSGASQGSTSSTGEPDQHTSGHSPSTVLAARAVVTASAAATGQVLTSSQIQSTQQSFPRRVNSMSTSRNNQDSIILPVASTAATSALAVGAGNSPSVAAATLQMQHRGMFAGAASSSSVSPINSTTTPGKQLTPTLNTQTSPQNYLLPISSIQMFVYYFGPIMDNLKHSDFLTSNQRLEIGAALWEPLFSHQLPRSIQCLIAPVKASIGKSGSSDAFFGSYNQTISNYKSSNQTKQQLSKQDSLARRRSSAFQESSAQFGDVFMGSTTSPPTETKQQPDFSASVRLPNKRQSDLIDAPHTSRLHGTSHSPSQAELNQLGEDITYATYLDVAVLRCLFVTDWQEAGVFWAVCFIENRLEEIGYYNLSDWENLEKSNLQRFKSKSLSCLETQLLYLDQLSKKEGALKAKETKEQVQKSTGSSKKQKSGKSAYLRVEDAETSDSGDGGLGGSNDQPKSPARRLSFSSGMHTLANQIRKTSKRVKKGSDNAEGVTSESQLNIQQQQQQQQLSPSKASSNLKNRRSSSADDLSWQQIRSLATANENNNKENRRPSPEPGQLKSSTEAPVVITVVPVSNKQHQSGASKKSRLEPGSVLAGGNKISTGKQSSETSRLLEKAQVKSIRALDALSRSQTVPSNLHISPFETRKDQADQSGESLGASHYIDQEGRIDPMVILKVIHSISMRESVCSQRVCDKLLTLLTKLINIGVMSENFDFLRRSSQGNGKNKQNLLPTRTQHEFKLLLHSDSSHVLEMDSEEALNKQEQSRQAAKRSQIIHKILIDVVFRLYQHLGCPNHCGMESTVDQHERNYHSKATNQPSSSGKTHSLTFATSDQSNKQLRYKIRVAMDYLCNHNRENFTNYVQGIVCERSIQQIIDLFHSILGFCHSEYLVNLTTNQQQPQQVTQKTASTFGSLSSGHSEVAQTQSELNTHNQQQISKKQANNSVPYSPSCLREPIETVETLIVTNSFKHLVTRLASINKELKLQENTALYCDIRRLIGLIRENFGGVFRGIILSALIDCAKILNQQQKSSLMTCEYNKNRADLTRPPSEDEFNGLITRRFDGDQDDFGSSGALHGKRQYIEGSPLMQHRTSFGSCRYYPRQTVQQGKHVSQQDQQQQQQQQQQHTQSSGILSLSKAKKKIEQVFGGSGGGSGSGGSNVGKTKVSNYQTGADDEIAGSQPDDSSRRASIVGHQSVGSFHESGQSRVANNVVGLDSPYTGAAHNRHQHRSQHISTEIQILRQNQQIYAAVQTGMSNFSFLMESCSPGDFLDPALLAALLDLKSPIAIRASIFLECANFVNRCNRGQWPNWMKVSVGGAQQTHRASNAGLGGHSNKFRKSSSIQRSVRSNTLMYRAAGRAFYSWAEAVGARLEELLQLEQDNQQPMDHSGPPDMDFDDSNAQELPQAEYQEVDFFQSQINGSSSPFALKMAACQLLFEVTTFLRETYRYLPPSIVHHQSVAGAKVGEKMSSIYDVSRAVTANRRWSMALSSLGFGQFPALSAISSAATAQQQQQQQQAAAAAAPASNQSTGTSNTLLRNPTTSVISEHPERRISFILHETNDENEQQLEQSNGERSQQRDSQADTNSSSNAQSVVSPIASSVNTNEQQEAAIRKLTSGRNLSQSSASSAVVVAAATCLLRSSGVIDSQTHRRKSIKLRKPNQEKEVKGDKRAKFAQDFEEEMENSSVSDAGGVRRTDSLRSRRRVSGISERSDTSDRQNGPSQAQAPAPAQTQTQAQQQPDVTSQQQQQQPTNATGELSGNESAGNGSCCDEALTNEASERIEADETRMMFNMPWFKAISLVNASIDCNCSHYPSCRPHCYKLHQAMCKRLVSFVQSIYDQEILLSEQPKNFAPFAATTTNTHSGGVAGNVNNSTGSASNAANNCTSNQKVDKLTGGLVRAGSDCSASVVDVTNEQKLSKKERKVKRQQQQQQQQLESPMQDSPYKTSGSNRVLKLTGAMSKIDPMSAGGISYMQPDASRALTAVKARDAREKAQRNQDEPQIVKYLSGNVKSLLQCPMSSFLKGAVILPREHFVEMIHFSWNLLLEDDQQLSRTAAVGFIIAAIKWPGEASRLLLEELESKDASRKMAAIQKFYVIWDSRYQCWPRLEDGAFVHFKMAPPSIEFTLPSPKIAQESEPVADPPWMPRKTSNVEEITIGQDQTVQKSFVTATKTRRKQVIENVTQALKNKHDELRLKREEYHITAAPITLFAAYEPTLSNQAGGNQDDMEGGGTSGNADEDAHQENRALLQMKSAQALFPTCLCQAAIVMINLLDDSRVTFEGSAVYEIASKVIWSCLIEDPALFLRHFFERLTRQNQSTIFQVLRRLIRFMPRLPPQAAYTLYNYLIGFVIYYIRCPVESSQKLISDTLSVLSLVAPSVHGLFLKDLKQILRKEQCDHNLLITANVPSAKKIIVHGSDSSGIPSQFPVYESTQFYHLLVDSLEFFGIEKPKQNEYFLIDVRTNHMHNIHSYVRDYYTFKRSQHPQLQLVNMDPNKAFEILQKQELVNQFLELGKITMSLSIIKSNVSSLHRVFFLHEELMKLPTFPRKAMETNFCLFRGPIGHQVFSMDRSHKISWVRVIARMFEVSAGFFLQLGDIQLFLNAISGIFVLHCEEASVSRLCLATFINATYQFKTIFATDGFMTIMATIVQVYSNHQNNHLLCRSIEFVCKQFYIMHRKPFLLQLFGSVAARLNTAELMQQNKASYPLSSGQQTQSTSDSSSCLSDPSRISPAAFFRLLQSLEKSFKDPLDILELVEAEKPLRAVDFCYQQDKEAIEILDIISLCVTVTAYASDSPRSTQMLIILETVVPLYMKHLSASTSKKAGQSMGKQAHKDELQKIQSISICIRTLIVNCEGLTRNFNGPLPSIDFRSSSIRRTGVKSNPTRGVASGSGANNSAGSPMDLYAAEEVSYSGVPESRVGKQESSKQASIAANATGGGHRSNKNLSAEESEIARGEFIVPRDTLLNLVAEFLALSTGRLVESAKKYVDLHQKHSSYELLDVKSHLRLAEVANSLLKFASTDPTVMACRGLIRYMNEVLPNTEWRQEAIRPALIMILKRLDKTFNRISKKTWVKRSTDWEGAKQLLKGAYLTFVKHPYIVHLPHLKSLISCCQNIILSDGIHTSAPLSSANLFHNFTSSSSNHLQGSQSASVVQQQVERSGNLLNVTSLNNSLSPSASTGGATSAPISSANQGAAPSFGVSGTGSVAERFAAAAAAAVTAAAASNYSISSQGFNSVTIRLIAMQLLQTGDSQTLESFIGSQAMNSPDKLEALMLNFLYPMCIRVCSGAKEAPKLRVCDIMYILNLVLTMLAPQSASSKSCSSTVNSPKATTDTSQFILSKITTTIGSTQTGATALGIVGQATHSTTSQHHQMAQHQENLKIGFLGLKILCVCFEAQLASEWIRISRVIRDLALQQNVPSSAPTQPISGPLWDFLDFVATYRFPMFILLLPMIKCQLAKKVREDRYLLEAPPAAHNAQCQRLINEKIQGCPATVCRSKSFLFVSLTAELRMLKEQLIAKRRLVSEGERQSNNLAAGQSRYLQSVSTGQPGAGNSSTLSPNQLAAQYGAGAAGVDGSSQGGEHQFTAYHRLSAALASFANQTTQAKQIATNQMSGTSAALKGACFAAQFATSTPIGPQISSELTGNLQQGGSQGDTQQQQQQNYFQSSIRLSGAKTREEARKVMNTILRRTSFPHNQTAAIPTQPAAQDSLNSERKNSQPPSPKGTRSSDIDLESGCGSQILMNPAMLMASAFPNPPRKSATPVEGSSILKQLVQTIDRNQRQKQQNFNTSQQQASSGRRTSQSKASVGATSSIETSVVSSRSETFKNVAHKHE